MTQHNLKIWQRYFEAVLSGKKKAEHRTNDRNFQVGDTLCLEEVIEPELTYTGRKLYVYVTHIILNGEMAILSIEPQDVKGNNYQEAITKAYGLLWDAPTHYDRRIIAARKILLSVMTKDMQREGITFARQEFNQ